MNKHLVAALACVSLAACEEKPLYSGNERILALDSATVRIASGKDTVAVRVELAETADARSLGLMERRQLDADAGMLFVYDSTQAPDAGFWMYRTRIPDIAFIDAAGVIRVILPMVPCETAVPEGCPSYPPGVPYRFALEMNAGFFQKQQIGAGGKILMSDLPARLKR